MKVCRPVKVLAPEVVMKLASLVKSAKVTATRSSSLSATVSASREQVVPLQVNSPKSAEASSVAATVVPSVVVKALLATTRPVPASSLMVSPARTRLPTSVRLPAESKVEVAVPPK